MKLLLDENIDVRFKRTISGFHDVFTVRDMGWNGIKNGELLTLLANHKFDCWIVVDKSIPYQQNITQLPCLVVVLDVFRNTLMHLQTLVPPLLELLQKEQKEKLVILKEQQNSIEN